MEVNELLQTRRSLRWTQAKMAQALGVSQSYYANMERGNLEIPSRVSRQVTVLEIVHRLAIVVGFNVG